MQYPVVQTREESMEVFDMNLEKTFSTQKKPPHTIVEFKIFCICYPHNLMK